MKNYIIFNTKTNQYKFCDENEIKQKQLQENQIKAKLTDKQIEVLQYYFNNHQNLLHPIFKIFMTYNQQTNKIVLFKILTDWKKTIENSHNINILQLVKNQLWLNTQHFYQGRHHYHLQNNLARSQMDIYQLGMFNYQRIKKGKSSIGQIIINPDNQYMLANLKWGQKIWSKYYEKYNEIETKYNNGEDIINCNIGYKKQLGQKPYSLSQILQWEKDHPSL